MYCHTDNKQTKKEKQKDSNQGEKTQPRNNKTLSQLTVAETFSPSLSRGSLQNLRPWGSCQEQG